MRKKQRQKFLFIRNFSALMAIIMFGMAIVSAQDTPDLTHLPIGDGNVSTAPQVGYVWSCQTSFNDNLGGAFAEGTWIHADGTFDFTTKAVVDGDVAWDGLFESIVVGQDRILTSNGLPVYHTTGIYPIASQDDAYQFDRNPNSIAAQSYDWVLPVNPILAESPSCLPMGAIGIMLSGVLVFNALDGPGRDAVAHETQDHCQGHPERTGEYHYHNLSDCVADHEETDSGHSALMGYALDGFGIYGHHGENDEVLTNNDLDECHGHSHLIDWDGAMLEMYHYHASYEYPYTLGCFRGTPINVVTTANGQESNAAGGNPPPTGGNLPPRGSNPPPTGGNPPPTGGNPPPRGGGNP